MRKVIEIRSEIQSVGKELGMQEIQAIGTRRLKEKVLECKDYEALQKIVLEVLKQDETFHDEAIKTLKEKSVLLSDELTEALRGE